MYDFMNLKEIAHKYNISITTLKDRAKKLFPNHKKGGQYLLKPKEVQEIIKPRKLGRKLKK